MLGLSLRRWSEHCFAQNLPLRQNRARSTASIAASGISALSPAPSPRTFQAPTTDWPLCCAFATSASSHLKAPRPSPSPRQTPPSGLTMAPHYTFPDDRLLTARDSSRTPLILISCGSFSPITYLHLRMFEMVNDWVKDNSNFEVVGGYLSPVADAYKKNGLVGADHRVEMCRLATQNAGWLMVDDWEAIKEEYTPTAQVLDHFAYEINTVRGGVATSSGERRQARIALMAGADLILTFGTPGVWADEDLDHILGQYGTFIVERSGTDMKDALELLKRWSGEIYIIPQYIQNDVSSTKIRRLLGENKSVRYLVPEEPLKYINQHGLFMPK